ncbi:uncharacterized protein HMPREF1541_07763 [Cyphellophora europaea CBS 101466]|uniref:Uncharacterized protein n=1 Tax=Cyphellophora europaea (strain CBS 101466) TaxID=1220924 RepID=W2RQY2_CYPE1|nr:uncharacterized protein HMPREF1541_07763 [Cyphellophora europaea CBS 101466]ETN38139.1 hypothetical protein HMPREF1541_07763 [Cyphellophora europaea CBS 101466]
MFHNLLPLLALCANPVRAQLLQCSANTVGTTYNGTAGSEQQLNSTTIRTVPARDANQGVAVDATHYYSIDNYSITKHHKANGTAIQQWAGSPSGPIIHLDGGTVINGTLFCPHSNYPQSPITSSVETWDVATMQHTHSHSFGIYRGSLTWVDQHPYTGVWYGAFANYDRVQAGQVAPYGLTMNTQLVEFVDGVDWEVARSWIFPEELRQSFSPMSNSGGSFGRDGWLYVAGHDASEVYVMGFPSAGSILTWVATIQAPEIAGQGIAWDRSGLNGTAVTGQTGSLYGISRESREVVEMEAPLQNCTGGLPLQVGRALPPGQFEDVGGD